MSCVILQNRKLSHQPTQPKLIQKIARLIGEYDDKHKFCRSKFWDNKKKTWIKSSKVKAPGHTFLRHVWLKSGGQPDHFGMLDPAVFSQEVYIHIPYTWRYFQTHVFSWCRTFVPIRYTLYSHLTVCHWKLPIELPWFTTNIWGVPWPF